MMKAYRTGLTADDLFDMPEREQAKANAERMQRIWEEEQKGTDRPSLARCVWVFSRTRVVLACIMLTLSTMFQFLGPVRF
jgi:hypothetical protein